MADKRIGGQLIEKLELHHLIIAYVMLAGERFSSTSVWGVDCLWLG